jgi:hypothetical protein
MSAESKNASPEISSSNQTSAPIGGEVRQDRWAALLLIFFAALFTLILVWEPLASLFRS